MSSKIQNVLLRKLLLQTQNKGRLWAAVAALFTGATLLMLAVLLWWNFQELLYGKSANDSLGATFITIGKQVTNATMGKHGATLFSEDETKALSHAPQVISIGAISSNHFPVYAMIGGNLAFSTDLPLESVPDSFLDKIPPDWNWSPGNVYLPIIISTQFLDIYNYVFAPSQGLPQLSAGSVKAISITVKAGPGDHAETYLAHVVGFSDRINAVLVPQSFIDYGNGRFATPGAAKMPSQLILKTRDPSDAAFVAYLQEHNYNTNAQNLRLSKLRSVVNVVVTATGVLALLLLGISGLVFVLFIELTIARAKDSLLLLLQLGYSPVFLARYLTLKFIPMVVGTMLASGIIVSVVQLAARHYLQPGGLDVSAFPGAPVWLAFATCTTLLVVLVVRAIQKSIK